MTPCHDKTGRVLRRRSADSAFALLAAACLWLITRDAHATDTWSNPYPGIRALHRTGPSNLSAFGAVVDLCAPGVSLRHTDFSERRRTTSSFGRLVGAQWAINADYSCRDVDVNAATAPADFRSCIGKPPYMTYGIAAHAGVPWPDPPLRHALLAFGGGRAEIYDYYESQEFEPWMQEALSGHWTLVRGGAVSLNGEMAQCPREPRTAIGLSQDRTQLVLAVVDGRNGRRGMDCNEMAAFLIELGADEGFGLDGGGSSTMWSAAGGVLNAPSDGSERVVGPHLAIFASGSGPAPFCDRPWSTQPSAPLPSVVPLGAPGRFHPQVPVRLFDTRHASLSGSLQGLARDAQGRVAAGDEFVFDALGRLGVPATATAVVANLTVVDAERGGYATVFPGQRPRPDTSSLNFTQGQAVANATVTAVDGTQRLGVYIDAAAHVLADLQGWFGPGGAGFVPAPARRLLDTRSGAPLEPRMPRTIVPPDASGAVANALGVTVLGEEGAGFVTVYPCDAPVPEASSVNHTAGGVAAGTVLARTGPQGICAVSETRAHLIVDTAGVFLPGVGLDYQPLLPARLVDTRQTTARWVGRVPGGTTARLELVDAPGFPAEAQAVALNVTAVSAADDGYAILYPCSEPRPETSNLNYRDGTTVANAVVVGAGGGSLCLYASGRTHFVIDLVGAFVAPQRPPAPDAGMNEPDAGLTEPDAGEASTDGGGDSRDAGADAADAGATPRDGATPQDPIEPFAERGGCRCAAGGTGIAATVVGLALRKRRRRSS